MSSSGHGAAAAPHAPAVLAPFKPPRPASNDDGTIHHDDLERDPEHRSPEAHQPAVASQTQSQSQGPQSEAWADDAQQQRSVEMLMRTENISYEAACAEARYNPTANNPPVHVNEEEPPDAAQGDAERGVGQATASARPSTTPSPSGASKRQENKKRKRRACVKARQVEDGAGWVDVDRQAWRADGHALISGAERTCLPDALTNLLARDGCLLRRELARAALYTQPDTDVRFVAADAWLRAAEHLDRSRSLTRVSQRFTSAKGGPEYALLNASGLFLVQLRVANLDHSDPDLHCVAYDGHVVLDNFGGVKVKVLTSEDRASPHTARLLFTSMYPGWDVRVQNVYELRRA